MTFNSLLSLLQLQRKKWALVAAKKKEKGQKESTTKTKTAKKDESAAVRLRKEKLKKEERTVGKSDISEDDDKIKTYVNCNL